MIFKDVLFPMAIAVFSALISNELLAWSSILAKHIVKFAARRFIPPLERERYENQYLADLEYLGQESGKITQLLTALDILRTAKRTGREVKRVSLQNPESTEDGIDRLSEVYTRVLSSLAMTVELCDDPARSHCERVAHNAVAMGRELGLSETQLETLHWGALLHDLGKISVPESILLKPGALTEQEHAKIQRHPTYGADLLESAAPGFLGIAQIIRHHHEWWNGQGFPNGLTANNIPLMSRIIAIVDVFDALTIEKPYRHARSPEKALAYIRENAGVHFDPSLIPLLEDLVAGFYYE